MKQAIKTALKRLITFPFVCWVFCYVMGFTYFINSDGQYLTGFLNWAREVPGGWESYLALCCFGCGIVGGFSTFVEIIVGFICDFIVNLRNKSGDK